MIHNCILFCIHINFEFNSTNNVFFCSFLFLIYIQRGDLYVDLSSSPVYKVLWYFFFQIIVFSRIKYKILDFWKMEIDILKKLYRMIHSNIFLGLIHLTIWVYIHRHFAVYFYLTFYTCTGFDTILQPFLETKKTRNPLWIILFYFMDVCFYFREWSKQ